MAGILLVFVLPFWRRLDWTHNMSGGRGGGGGRRSSQRLTVASADASSDSDSSWNARLQQGLAEWASYSALAEELRYSWDEAVCAFALLGTARGFLQHFGASAWTVRAMSVSPRVIMAAELWHEFMPKVDNDGNVPGNIYATTRPSCCTWGELFMFPGRLESEDKDTQRAGFLALAGMMGNWNSVTRPLFQAGLADDAFRELAVEADTRRALERECILFWVRRMQHIYRRGTDGKYVPKEGSDRVALHDMSDGEDGEDGEQDSDSAPRHLGGGEGLKMMEEYGFAPALYKYAQQQGCLWSVLCAWNWPVPTVVVLADGRIATSGAPDVLSDITIGDVLTWPAILLHTPASGQGMAGGYNLALPSPEHTHERYEAMLMLARAHSPSFLEQPVRTEQDREDDAAERITERQFAQMNLESNRVRYMQCQKLLIDVLRGAQDVRHDTAV